MRLLALGVAILFQAEGDLYRKVSSCSVEILVDGRLNGSGWIADREGHVVTAAHVVWRKKGKLEVRLPSGTVQPAKRVALDLGHDLALIKLPERDKPWPHLTVAPEPPPAGTEVHVFGSPQFRHRLLLPGKVAKPGAGYEYLSDLGCAVRVVHIGGDAPKGMSGGCWVDSKGRVVANQSGGITIQGHSTGISFAAPVDAIGRLVKTRESATTVDAGIIVEELDEHGARKLADFPSGVRGVLGVICARADLKPWFIIGSVNGSVIETRDGFYTAIRKLKAGDAVKLSVFRRGSDKAEEVEVTLRKLEP